MYKKNDLSQLLYFDCEAIPAFKWEELKENLKILWLEKFHYKHYAEEIEFRQKKKAIEINSPSILENKLSLEISFEEIYNKYAALHHEFAKVWCISFGIVKLDGSFEINTIQNDNEKELLTDWSKVCEHFSNLNLCGYNIGGYDIPLILKRMWVNGILEYSKQFQLKDAKPWTTSFVDLMVDWKNIGWEATSLAVICEILGVNTPKDKFNNYEFTTLLLNGKITVEDGIEYCEKDVRALMECCFKLSSPNSNFLPETTKKVWKK